MKESRLVGGPWSPVQLWGRPSSNLTWKLTCRRLSANMLSIPGKLLEKVRSDLDDFCNSFFLFLFFFFFFLFRRHDDPAFDQSGHFLRTQDPR